MPSHQPALVLIIFLYCFNPMYFNIFWLDTYILQSRVSFTDIFKSGGCLDWLVCLFTGCFWNTGVPTYMMNLIIIFLYPINFMIHDLNLVLYHDGGHNYMHQCPHLEGFTFLMRMII